jgi:hypothetical protein
MRILLKFGITIIFKLNLIRDYQDITKLSYDKEKSSKMSVPYNFM